MPKSRIVSFLAAGFMLSVVSPTIADTTNVKWRNIVEIKKTGAHCVDDPNCFNRYHPAIKPVATAKPGDHIIFHTRDALDADLDLGSVADDLAAVDLNLVHPMTGPVFIEGAQRGDVLAVKLVDIEPDEYGYTVIVPGFGFLRDKFTEPFLVNWQLTRNAAVSDQMPGVAVPYEAFPGSIGVLPGDAEVAAWNAREAALGAAGGVVCHQSQQGRCRPPCADRKAATRPTACAPSRRAKTAAIWMCNRCNSARRCCCPVSSTAAACLSATSIMPRATARFPGPP